MENLNQTVISNKRNIPKLITTGCLIIIAVFSIFTFLKTNKTISTISVTGQADISTQPNSVKFVVTRVNAGNEISLAIDDGNNGINRLINIAKEFGDPNIEIKKTFYQITSSSTSFSVANAFSVETSNTDNIDTLIKKLYQNGATTVSNITFESKNIKTVEDKLRQDVYADALKKAKLIAKSAGRRLGKVISITDDNTSITSTIEDLKTNNGSINVSKSASVIYKIW